MSVFKDYSKYYNLLYKDKDYVGETNYVIDIIKRHSPAAKRILNLGCGTGNHDFIFNEKGFHVTGIDLSHDMVAVANERKNENNTIDFLQGDVRTLNLNKTFDVVMSLFHVMSYQTSDEDLHKAFTTAYNHLEPGGIFVFDCWYGPGVLTDRPTIRNKHLENNELLVERLSTPKMYANDNCVDVIFDVKITDKASQQQYNIHEVHKMRYLFLPELMQHLTAVGFKTIISEEWLTGKELSFNSWNATLVCIK